MTAPLQGAATLIGVEMGRVGCEVSEVSSLTSQRPQLFWDLTDAFFHSPP
jgi:hypothetical protein